jgi:hypothetical protein
MMARVTRFCIVCGCTNDTPCPGRCGWLNENRCTACAGIVIQRRLTPEEATALQDAHRTASVQIAGTLRRALSMHLHSGRMTVRIESRHYVWRLTPAGREFLAAVKSADSNAAKAAG